MTTVVIPQNIGKTKELVAVPRNVYEEFLEWHKVMKSIRVARPTATEKKAIACGRRAFEKGDYVTLEQLEKEFDLR